MDIQTEHSEVHAPTAASAYDSGIKRGASWFFWVAALSLLSQIAMATGTNFTFAVSLGITDVLGAVASEFKSQAMTIITWVLGVGLVVTIGMCGYFSSRKSMIAFITGLVILLLDSFILMAMLPHSLLGLIFRCWAVYQILGGISALKASKKLEAA